MSKTLLTTCHRILIYHLSCSIGGVYATSYIDWYMQVTQPWYRNNCTSIALGLMMSKYCLHSFFICSKRSSMVFCRFSSHFLYNSIKILYYAIIDSNPIINNITMHNYIIALVPCRIPQFYLSILLKFSRYRRILLRGTVPA